LELIPESPVLAQSSRTPVDRERQQRVRYYSFAALPANRGWLREADFRDNALFIRLGTGPRNFCKKKFHFSE
jgi:hypothetical protein